MRQIVRYGRPVDMLLAKLAGTGLAAQLLKERKHEEASAAFRAFRPGFHTEVGPVICHLHKIGKSRGRSVAYYDCAYTRRSGQRVSERFLYGYNFKTKQVYQLRPLSRVTR